LSDIWSTVSRRAWILAALAVAAGSAAAPSARAVLPYKPAGDTPFTVLCDDPTFKRDANGIPLIKYPTDYVYNPGIIAMCGLYQYDWYVSGHDTSHLAYAERIGAWLLTHQRKSSGAWTYPFDFPLGGTGESLKAPWPSAYSQGVGMSLFTRLYRATLAKKYLNAAIRGMHTFELPVPKRGILIHFVGHPFYEEYPGTRPTMTLNGFMVSLIGLYDLQQTLHEFELNKNSASVRTASKLFREGLATLRFVLPFYDTGSSSMYWLAHLFYPKAPVFIHPSYQSAHILELKMLESVTHDKRLQYFIDLWSAYPGT
jgi:heparosan-N-sulfate-glucuronate 5-epimerase